MTNTEILLKMREEIKCGGRTRCLCHAYRYATGEEATEQDLLNLGLRKPEKPYNNKFWYNPYDTLSRLNAIDEILNSKKPAKEIELDEAKMKYEARIREIEDKYKVKTLEGFYEERRGYFFTAQTGAIYPTDPGFGKGSYPSEHTANKAMAQCKLMQIAFMQNGGDYVPENGEKAYCLYVNRESSEIIICNTEGSCGEVFFRTRELAEQARQYITDDEIKLALL